MLNTLEIHEDAIEAITTKIAADVQDFLAGDGDVTIDFDTFEVLTDDAELEVEVEIIDGEIDLHVDFYHSFRNYEEHTTETVYSIVEAVDYVTGLIG